MTTVEFQLGGTLRFLVDEPASRPGARITIHYGGLTLTAWGDGMAYKLPNDKVIAVQVAYVDSRGNPAQVDGDVSWDTSDSNIATVESNASDSTQAVVTPGGPVGQVQVTVTADADLGQGVREIITTMDVDIVAGEAVAGTITPVGEPQPIEPTPTPLRMKR
jgi:hypothetical protein